MPTLIYRQENVPSTLMAQSLKKALPLIGLVFVAEIRINGYNQMYTDQDDEEDSREERGLESAAIAETLLNGELHDLSLLLRLLDLGINFEQLSTFVFCSSSLDNRTKIPTSEAELKRADLIIEYRDSWLLFISTQDEVLIAAIAKHLPSECQLVDEEWPFGAW